ncbi:hypothetical protein N0V88_002480 [Collariella sp. IMI 366227]|nr:hypothetical protein N0V88_002480 [Collariella sp. IMI 366227]
MSGPSSKELSKRPAGQATSAEEAALMREMMASQSRQDDLPLDDEPIKHDGGCHHRGGGGHHGRLLLPAPFHIDDAWKLDAIESGEFDDEEAAGVKGLDNLGGGRIYSNTLKATMQMLDQNNRNRSRQYTQWPLSLWDDYTSGADHQLCVRFVDGEGASQGYDIRFRSGKDIKDFMTTTASSAPEVAASVTTQVAVKAPAVAVSSAAPTTPAPVEGTAVARMPMLAPVSTSTAGSALKTPMGSSKGPEKGTTTSKGASLPATGGSPTLARTFSPATSETQHRAGKGAGSAPAQPPTGIVKSAAPAAASATNGNAEPMAVVEVTLPPSKIIKPSGQNNTKSLQTGKPGGGTLIDFEGNDEGDTTSLPQSEAVQLLSTLEPYDSNDIGTVSFSSEEIRKVITMTLRGLMTFFCSMSQMTPGQADETAKGVKSGVRAHLIKDATSQGFGGQDLEKYKAIIDEVLGTIPFLASGSSSETFGSRGEPSNSSGAPGRLQYTAEELLSWRQGAVEPSVRLADIPHLPLPQNGRLTTGSLQELAPCNRKPELIRYRPSQLRKSADGMQWVLGEDVSPQQKPEAASSSQQLAPRNRRLELARYRSAQPRKSAPQQEPEKAIDVVAGTPAAATPVAVSTVTMPGVAEDSGLQSSRWATGTSEIKYTNYFTGPQYEKTWSKRSYLWDLAQIDPQAKMNVGTEDIVNFYFPVEDKEDIPADEDIQPAIASMPANEDTLTDVSAPQPATDSSQMLNNGFGNGSRPGYDTPIPYARTDSIERLRDSLSRLSIRSPVAAASRRGGISEVEKSSRRPSIQASSNLNQLAAPRMFESVRLPSPVSLSSAAQPRSVSVGLLGQALPAPAAQPRVRGLAASRHSLGAGLSSSGEFNFHVPSPARQ